MVTTIIKRDGRTAEFKQEKIAEAVEKAFQACAAMQDRAVADEIADKVVAKLDAGAIEGTPTVEGVQDLVEETLIESGFVQTAKSYILYRAERSRVRDVNSRLIQTLKDITFSKASDSDMKRENANIDADTAMGTMLKYGSESAKQFYEMCVIEPKFARAHREGDIHIHDMDFYTLTTTCCQSRAAQAVQGRLLHRPRRAARAERHRQLRGAGLHRYPEQPERPARWAVGVRLRLRLGRRGAQDVPPPVQEASGRGAGLAVPTWTMRAGWRRACWSARRRKPAPSPASPWTGGLRKPSRATEGGACGRRGRA